MSKEIVASALLAAAAVGLAGLAVVWAPLRRYLLCGFFLGVGKVLDVNWVSREDYRGWVRGFEIGSLDVLVVALIAAVLAGPGRRPVRFLPALMLPILAWVTVAFVSAFTAEVPLYAGFGLLKLVRYTLAFWAVANAVRDETDLRWLLWTFVACAGLQSFDAVQDYLKGVYRVRGSFDHSNTLGMYLNMFLPIVFSALMNLRTRWRGLLLAVFGLGAGTVVLTLSRGSWVALGLALAVVLPLSFVLRLRPEKLALVAFMVTIAIPPGAVAVQKMIRRIQEAPASSGEARVEFNRVARQMASDRAFGIGINNYSYGTDGPYSEPFGDGLDRGGLCHNLYFLTTGELGWGGLAALLSVFAAAFAHGARFLWRQLDEDLRSIVMLGWVGSLVTVAFQSTLEWAPVQTGLGMTFFGLLAVGSATARLPAGASVARWTISWRAVPPPAGLTARPVPGGAR